MYSIYKFSHYISKLNTGMLNIMKNIFDFKLIFTGFEQLYNMFNDKNNEIVLNQIQSIYSIYLQIYFKRFLFLKLNFKEEKN
jgi:hypothetical protein